MKTRLPRSLLLALASSSLALAQNRVVPTADMDAPSGQTGAASAGAESLAGDDLRFLRKTSLLNEKEVALSRVAAERATHPELRSFASEMVREHSAAGEKLRSLADRQGLRMDPDDLEKLQKEKNEWAEKKTDGFDDDYAEAMVEAHKDTVEALEKGAESKNAEIAALARELLPKVKAHLQRAQELEKLVDD